MVKILNKLQEWLYAKSKKPWAVFEIDGFDEGRIKVNFRWNRAFILKVNSLGFAGETEEETVMLFYYMSQMTPNGDDSEAPVQSEEHPTLTSASNQIKV